METVLCLWVWVTENESVRKLLAGRRLEVARKRGPPGGGFGGAAGRPARRVARCSSFSYSATISASTSRSHES